MQHHQFCLLGQRHRKCNPCPPAAITFCTLPEHSPDPTITDYSLGIPIRTAIRALPQSCVHWALMHLQPWSPTWPLAACCLRDGELPSAPCGPGPIAIPTSLLAAPRLLPCPCAPGLPFQGKQGTRWHGANQHVPTSRRMARSHGRVVHCNVSGNVHTVLVFATKIFPQRRCEDGTSGNSHASLHSCLNPVTQHLLVIDLNTSYWSYIQHVFPLFHSLPVVWTTSLGFNQKFIHRRNGRVSSPVFTLFG